MLSFYSSRHHPFIKQVHSVALNTILPQTKGLFLKYHTAFRKQNNTETEVAKYTNTTICARHHSGKKWATSPKFSLAMLSGRDSSEAAT